MAKFSEPEGDITMEGVTFTELPLATMSAAGEETEAPTSATAAPIANVAEPPAPAAADVVVPPAPAAADVVVPPAPAADFAEPPLVKVAEPPPAFVPPLRILEQLRSVHNSHAGHFCDTSECSLLIAEFSVFRIVATAELTDMSLETQN
jgi:hypothetical protein